jgi:oligoendopeptidase F
MEIPSKKTRRFLPYNLNIKTFEDIEPYLIELTQRNVNHPQDFDFFLMDISETEAVLEEEGAWRYIKMSINTSDKELADSYSFFIQEIAPKIAPFENELNKMVHASEYKSQLKQKEDYQQYFKNIGKELEIYREKNIPLQAELGKLAQEYGATAGKMQIEYQGEEYTLPQTSKFLKQTDRNVRKEMFDLVSKRRLEDSAALNTLFSTMVEKRQTVAENAGFANFRDYKFAAMGRFDYTPENCSEFHESVKKHILPLVNTFYEKRKEELGLEILKPWDLEVDTKGREPLKPFETGKELLEKTISVFDKIDPYFSECLNIMDEMGHLDLESKKGKAPGGYNYPLYEIGVPFIFMNAVGSHSDLVTMVHEGGHAVHSFLTRQLKLCGFKSLPSEVAELASMSTELISMEYWDEFYKNEEDLSRAKRDQLFRVLSVLPWVATIDKFQHWIYENPKHTSEERENRWVEIFDEFSSPAISWDGLEDIKKALWQKQLHIFEVPFYYIEYGFAQLGAISVWKNYENDKDKALYHFKKALELGYTASIPEIYETAKIKFDFSDAYISKLASFVKKKL